MPDLYRFAGPLLRALDPETAHGLALKALEWGIAGRDAEPEDPILAIDLFGRRFPNPIGLAAGFDKDARVPNQALGLGFGFAEIGSVTPKPQPGNPKPRLFRLTGNNAVINRMGFNSEGHAAAAARLDARPRHGIVGVNLGRNKDSADAAADFVAGVKLFAARADYLVVNLSSPNTPGLRAMQSKAPLEDLLAKLQAARGEVPNRPPLLIKIAPDLAEDELVDIAEVAPRFGVDGLIVSNTTIARPESLKGPYRAETGGLSGAPLFLPSTNVLARVFELTDGKIPLIGCGGVSSGADAYAKIRAGASLVQLYTALVYEGPGLVRRIKRDLAALLRRNGFKSVNEAVGA